MLLLLLLDAIVCWTGSPLCCGFIGWSYTPFVAWLTLTAQTLLVLGCRSIILANNQLSGSLPEWLGHLPAVQYVDVSANALEGTIPEVLQCV